MKYKTAQTIVCKLMYNKPVKLRKNKYGAISVSTWVQLCNVLFNEYNCYNVTANYNCNNTIAVITAKNPMVGEIVTSKVFLY
jgi:hypothetical protein